MAAHTMETQDETPPEKLPVPQVMSGIGNAHIQITATPEAQKWFDQGLNLLHDFWDYESARAFQQSIRVDPQCAICYWGLYKAESFYHSTAQDYAGQALAKAVSLAPGASEQERLYIEATAVRSQAPKTESRDSIQKRELELWRKLVADYPKEVQGRIFLSMVDPKDGRTILESILKEDPENSAANHYYIHQREGSDHPEEALRSAEILGRLAPASGHMVHMPGHIFFRVGDYARAEAAFAASMDVDERYMKEQHVDPDNDWNYVHNLMYAIANLMEEGKLKEATELSGKLTNARGKLETTLYVYSSRDSMSRLDPRLPVALRTADWPAVIRLVDGSPHREHLPNLEFLARELREFAAGMQAVGSRNFERAGESSGRFDAELQRMSTSSKSSESMPDMRAESAPVGPPKLTVMADALLPPLLRTLSIMSLELRASLLAARGKTSEATGLFAKAAQEENALGYREPPNYIRPVGETEGAAMLAGGNWVEAKVAYGRALLERPRSGFVLFGMAMVNEKSGDTEAAVRGYRDFLTAWKSADGTLPEIRQARSYVAEHGVLQ